MQHSYRENGKGKRKKGGKEMEEGRCRNGGLGRGQAKTNMQDGSAKEGKVGSVEDIFDKHRGKLIRKKRGE
jgi:hypothetical protein